MKGMREREGCNANWVNAISIEAIQLDMFMT